MTMQEEPASSSLSYRSSVPCVSFILSSSLASLVHTECKLSEADNSLPVWSAYHDTTSLITWVARHSSSNKSSNLLLDMYNSINWERRHPAACALRKTQQQEGLQFCWRKVCVLCWYSSLIFQTVLIHQYAGLLLVENSWMKGIYSFNLFAANVQKLGFSCTYFAWQKR